MTHSSLHSGRHSTGIRFHRFFILTCALGLVIVCHWNEAVAQSADRAPVVVQLRRHPQVSQREVRLADIATIQTSSDSVAAALGQLDVATIDADSTAVEIRKSFVRIRILLSGWDSGIVVTGPDELLVEFTPPKPLNDVDIEQAALETMCSVMGVEESELKVRLTAPFIQSLPSNIQQLGGLRADVLPPLRSDPGQSSMTVRLWKDHVQVASRSARFDVLKRQRVAVMRVSLQRETEIQPDDVQFENRFLATTVDEPVENDVYGQIVRTPLSPGQMLSMRDLKPATTRHSEIAVRARTRVTATVQTGPLRVQLARAEAMNDGRIGETIMVRNLESGRTFSARVVGAGAVEIVLRTQRAQTTDASSVRTADPSSEPQDREQRSVRKNPDV